MFKTKQLTKFIVLINILLIGFLLSILINPNVNAVSDNDLVFNFEKDVLFEQDDTNFYKDFNTRNFITYEDTGIFKGTHSFEDEVGETGIDIDFVDNIITGTSEQIEVIDTLDGHDDILFLNSTVEITHNHTDITGRLWGTDEFWFRTTNGYSRVVFSWKNNDNYNLGLWRIYQGTIWEQFIGAWVDTTIPFSQDVWHHIQFSWEYTSGGFMGLSESQCNIRLDEVDHIYSISDYNYYINHVNFKVDTINDAYLDAYGEYREPYTGISFDIGTQDVNCFGLTYYNDYFWSTGTLNDKVHKYYLNGTYTGTYFSITQDAKPWGIDYYDNHFWIVGESTDTLYKYTVDGTYTDISYYLGTQGTVPSGITWFNNYFYITDINQDKVFKYYSNGTYTEDYFSTLTQDSGMAGIIQYNNYFWITGYQYDRVYKYYLNGTYTGDYFNTSIQDGKPLGITQHNGYFWIVGGDNNYVYKYTNKSSYALGDNLIPEEQISDSGTEVDRWEFSHDSLFDRLDDGQDNPNGWTDLEDGEDDVNCRMYDDFDGVVELYANSGDSIGLYRDNIGYSEDIALNVSFGFEIKYIYSVVNNDVYLKVFSSDNTEIVRIRINDDGTLKYWVSGTTYTQLDTGFVIDTNYSINLAIDYDTDKCTLRYDTNEVFTNSFEFSLTTVGKTGLKKVSFEACADTDYVKVYLDWIGIYVNYRSITTDFGSIGLHISDHSYWYFNEYNLLTVNIIGDGISIYLDVASYVAASPNFVHEVLITSDDYIGLNFFNLYDYLYDDYWGYPYIWGGVLWFHFYDTFEFNSATLEGVKLTESENEYSLEFDYSGVNIIDNYFYVLDNKLYFTQTSNDTNLEYIQATFDIENVLTENYSVSYNSILTGNAQGHFRISYIDGTSTLLPLRTYTAAPNVILPQDKEIKELIILITDNDNDDVEGTTTGYITSIKLVYLPDVSITIITIALLSIMIPLLILIIPTFLIYLRLGKNAIIPTFLLMSFICFITNLIPLWLFFIILLSSGVFIVAQKVIYKDEVE